MHLKSFFYFISCVSYFSFKMEFVKVGLYLCVMQLLILDFDSTLFKQICKIRHLTKLKYIIFLVSGSNVNAYISMVCDTLKNTIPKAVVYCQVREAKRSLLNYFYVQVGKKEVRFCNFCSNFYPI